MSEKVYEYRGVRGLVAAEVIKDDVEGIEFGEVFPIAGVAEIGKETENSSEPHFYDNAPKIVVDSIGADTITCSVSAIPLKTYAKLTGQKYLDDLGVLVEGKRESKYFALGYITSDTDNCDVYVWRHKGSFSIPGFTHGTKTAGTEANGQELVYTGIETIYKFKKTGDSEKSTVVETALQKVDVSTFFDTVTTVDDLVPVTP